MIEPSQHTKMPEKPLQTPVFLFIAVGIVLALIDRTLKLNTFLLECIHGLVVTSIFLSCLVFERRHNDIRQFGWNYIVLGIALLMCGTWIDIIDDPPLFGAVGGFRFPLGSSWELSFLKTTLGYTIGIGLFASGFFQWIPWMIRTRLDMQKLNNRLSTTNRNLNRAMMSLDEHIESERVAISRELHDDVAQQLTYINIQIQLCKKDLDSGASIRQDSATQKLEAVSANVSQTLKSVRQISGDLRPESLFSLGLIPALEQFIEKLHHQYPEQSVFLSFYPLQEDATHTRLEKESTDKQLLHLFRVVQEAVRNALKHSKGETVEVVMRETEDDAYTRLQIEIVDDGVGLPWAEVPSDDVLIAQGHLGIVGLKERVKELGGTFCLKNRTDELTGTCVEIILTS